jgi:DNA-binding beta-propeller fold protein YncE
MTKREGRSPGPPLGREYRREVVRLRGFLGVSAVLLMFTGCHGLTEYEGTIYSGVVFVRTDDLSVEYVMEGFGDGRAIMSLDGSTFYVMGYEGTLYRADSDSMRLDTTLSIWSGPALSPLGMTSPFPGNDLYILGNGPAITEVSVISDQITDIFSAGPSPACIVSSRNVTQPSFYVGDSQEERIREVEAASNQVLRSAELGYSPYALDVDGTNEFLLVSAFYDQASRVMIVGLDPIYPGQVTDVHGTDIEAPAGYPGFFMTDPDWEDGSGSLVSVVVQAPGGLSTTSIEMPGHPLHLCSSPDGARLYILSVTDEAMALFIVYDIQAGRVVDVLGFDGYPWDVAARTDGEYVLLLIAN